MPGGSFEKSKLGGKGGGGGRPWPGAPPYCGGGGGKVPLAIIARSCSGSMPASPLARLGGGPFGKFGGGGMFDRLANLCGEGPLLVPLIGMVRPGIPGRRGCLIGIFWSCSPSASSSSSCSSSSRMFLRPPRLSQVP
jgi:hypothetical protein